MASEISCISSLKPDRRSDFLDSISRRDYVIRMIGLENLDKFEEWAFRSTCIIYNRNVATQWANIHSAKEIPEHPDLAVQAIIKLWRTRGSFESKEDIVVLRLIDWSSCGPGLDSDEDI